MIIRVICPNETTLFVLNSVQEPLVQSEYGRAAKRPVSNLWLGALVVLADLHEFELPINFYNLIYIYIYPPTPAAQGGAR